LTLCGSSPKGGPFLALPPKKDSPANVQHQPMLIVGLVGRGARRWEVQLGALGDRFRYGT